MKLALLTSDARESFRDYGKPAPIFGTAPAALLEGFADQPALQVHVVSCYQRQVACPKKLAPNIHFTGLHVPRLGWLRSGYLGCIKAVRRYLKVVAPDIVHGQGTERDCAISAVWSGYPNVLTIHGNMRLIAEVTGARPFSFNWIAGYLERITLPRTNGVICITNYTRGAVSPLARRTWLLPNAVDSSFFRLEVIPPSRPTVLVIGNVDVRKNQNHFIRSLDPLAKRYPLQIVFLGQVSERDSYGKEFLTLIGERPWCVYEGFVDRSATKAWFQKSTMLALPTREDNCPMVVLEAMAAGLPVAASRVGGIPDLIEDEVTGLLFDPTRPETFLKEVQRILNQPAVAQAMAARAKAMARTRFHPSVIANHHLAIYEEVLSEKANRCSRVPAQKA